MSDADNIAHLPPGKIFPWPKGCILTALDEAILAIPAAILSTKELIGSVIHCEDDVKVNLPTSTANQCEASILIWLKEGQSVWLTKSCQAMVVPTHKEDKMTRRFRLSQVTKS